ncbi:hypothetical protein [Microbacterium sp. Leaf203]|uniref:hypothetical protein n=1 Tax=Microbacterium sp. Leaf203 TaxID=1735677 RepID=UPI0006FF6BAC|nr:hypothetical protein [Microbacterium sp. Leaf203]KQM36849.1 hypothetical protein ASE56_10570 [Microbacterium sp. Leaf203]
MKKSIRFFLQFGFGAAFTLVLTIALGIRAESHYAAGEVWSAVGLTGAALLSAILNALHVSALAAGATHILGDYLDDIVYERGLDVEEPQP